MPQHVLLVDDDEGIRESLGEVLAEEGYEVSKASNGREALTLLESQQRPPCLVLLDLMMPVMNGWQLLDELRANGTLSSLCIVIMSAMGNRSTVPTDVRGYLPKPLGLEELLDAVARHCAAAAH